MSKFKKISVVALLLGSVLGTTFTMAGPACDVWENDCKYQIGDYQRACALYNRHCW